METKDTNPKDAVGGLKLPLHLVPTTGIAIASLAFLEGALKYGRLNWRETGVKATVYIDACKRHLDAWLEGEEVAPDTGTPHLANAIACIMIIVDARAAGKLDDDRNYGGAGYRALVDSLTPHVAALKAQFAAHRPTHYTIKTVKPTPVDRVKIELGGPIVNDVIGVIGNGREVFGFGGQQ